MGLLDSIKKFLAVDEEEETREIDDEEYEEEEEETYIEHSPIDVGYDTLPENSIFIYRAHRFEDVRDIKPIMKRDIPVVVDLSAIDDKDERRRFLDFAWGMSKAGGGKMKVLDRIELMFAVISPSEKWYIAEEESNAFPEDEELEEGEEL